MIEKLAYCCGPVVGATLAVIVIATFAMVAAWVVMKIAGMIFGNVV